MVSKIAVIALVAIVACPILLGYAMNLTEVSETGYQAVGESVNVTPVLQNGTEYSYTHADTLKLNTDIYVATGSLMPIEPIYEKTTSVKTSLPGIIAGHSNSSNIITTGASGSSFPYLSYYMSYKQSEGYITMYYTFNGGLTSSVAKIHAFQWDASTGIATVYQYLTDTTWQSWQIADFESVSSFSKTGNYFGTMYVYYLHNGEERYVDVAAGFHVNDANYALANNKTLIEMPTNTISSLMSVNLNSITDSSYQVMIDGIVLKKTTVGGVVNWTAQYGLYGTPFDIYYDPTISDNTYQYYKEVKNGNTHQELRYVGHWPTLIGEANYYQKYSFDYPGTYFSYIVMDYMTSWRTPTIRMDDAFTRAFEYPVISNKTYDPAAFKENPITTIADPQIYGTSLTFGGNTYTVTDGKITLGTHQIPVKGLQLSSTPNGSGTYDNKIGNTLISTSATPSTITFNGKWSASISTQSMDTYTYTHTEWTPGHFGWDGVDQNFLIVGLITCLGVFVALGIYARRKGSGGIIPLMIAVGCAATVFFIML